jgi:hypothetical protein
VAPILEAIGPLPHARLDTDRKPEADSGEAEDASISTRPRKQANRHVKCTCTTYGYVVRTARKWLDDIGPPLCPQHGPMVSEIAVIGATMPARLIERLNLQPNVSL